MPDMLVRLYDLPSPAAYDERTTAAGVNVRRIDAWDRAPLLKFVREHFGEGWAAEAEFAFDGGHPITGFVAVKDGVFVGFAVYETSRRGFFGPTGVRPDMRKQSIGASLLFRCLEGMRELGYAYAIIGGVGPAEFYEKTCGAKIIEGSERSVYGDLYDEARTRARARQRT
ncbi:MAG TPA: GNAT family N-acetyltransferase [Dehalococcoidia bacterium]|nr:GNAT family N-acetyltransferase [Dehalococcoidia bacterium]